MLDNDKDAGILWRKRRMSDKNVKDLKSKVRRSLDGTKSLLNRKTLTAGKVNSLSDIFKKNIQIIKPLLLIFNVILIFGLFYTGCSSPNKNENPEVYDLIALDSLIRGFPDIAYIFISVRDPQGLDNIDSVYFTTTKPDGSPGQAISYMHDDGIDGDSVEADGIYTVGIWSDTTNDTGNYVFHFTAMDKDNHQANTIDHNLYLYDWPNPVITIITVNQYDTQRQHLYVSAKVLDVQGQENIDSVWVEMTYIDSSDFIGAFILNDDGIDGDSTESDKYFSKDIVDTQDSIWVAGSYQLEFTAVDYNGNLAVPVDTTIEINPPVIF